MSEQENLALIQFTMFVHVHVGVLRMICQMLRSSGWKFQMLFVVSSVTISPAWTLKLPVSPITTETHCCHHSLRIPEASHVPPS